MLWVAEVVAQHQNGGSLLPFSSTVPTKDKTE